MSSASILYPCAKCGTGLDPIRPAVFELCPACEAAFRESTTARVALQRVAPEWIAQAKSAPKARPSLRLVTPDGEPQEK